MANLTELIKRIGGKDLLPKPQIIGNDLPPELGGTGFTAQMPIVTAPRGVPMQSLVEPELPAPQLIPVAENEKEIALAMPETGGRPGAMEMTPDVGLPAPRVPSRMEQKQDGLFDAEIPAARDNWKQKLGTIALGALQGFERGGVAGALGGAAGAGIVGTVNPRLYNQQKRERNIARAKGEIAEESKFQDEQLARRGKTAQIENIYADNELNKVRADDMRNYRTEQLEQKEKDRVDKAVNEIKKRKYYDPKRVSEADRKALTAAGLTPEDLGSWDNRNPTKHVVNGETYLYDHNSKTFKPAEGVAKDPNKQIVEVNLTDPVTGNVSTYEISADKAASLESMAIQRGLQYQLGRENLAESKRRTNINTDLRRQQLQTARESLALTRQKWEADQQSGGKNTDALKQKIVQIKASLLTRKNKGELEQAEYDQLISELPNIQ